MMVFLYSVAGVLGVSIFVGAVRTGKPIRSLLGGALQGACALAAVNVACAFTGVSLGINWFSGAVCLALGVPGVITILLLKLIFGI
ncbi:MAG: pro-sigmaK processing inhibitor BofA family protein [Clostridia bacterium]|nr:pro-sigmaK processing inhibitor BofA family protein [Clostridia bacterium]